MVKEIKAYVREIMLEQVISELAHIEGIPGIAVVHLQEYGHVQDGGLERVKMAKLEVDVLESLARTVVDAIVASGRTGDGHPGDGKVFISDLRDAIRISDGHRNEAAVQISPESGSSNE